MSISKRFSSGFKTAEHDFFEWLGRGRDVLKSYEESLSTHSNELPLLSLFPGILGGAGSGLAVASLINIGVFLLCYKLAILGGPIFACLLLFGVPFSVVFGVVSLCVGGMLGGIAELGSCCLLGMPLVLAHTAYSFCKGFKNCREIRKAIEIEIERIDS